MKQTMRMTEDLAQRIMRQVAMNITAENLNLGRWATRDPKKSGLHEATNDQMWAATPACGTPACFFGHISFADPTPVNQGDSSLISQRGRRVLTAIGVRPFDVNGQCSLSTATPKEWPQTYASMLEQPPLGKDYDPQDVAQVAAIMANDLASGKFLKNEPGFAL